MRRKSGDFRYVNRLSDQFLLQLWLGGYNIFHPAKLRIPTRIPAYNDTIRGSDDVPRSLAYSSRSVLPLLGVLLVPGLVQRPVRGRPAPMPRDVSAKPKGTLEYNRDMRPILAENCFACHGPDSAARKANLRLDRRDDAMEVKAIVPGKPGESGLVERIFAERRRRAHAPAPRRTRS